MIELLKYQLIVSICIIVFYGFYKIFLKNETFFNFNRFLILFLISISFAIPLLKIGTSLPIVPQKPEIITIGQSSEIVSQPIEVVATSIPAKATAEVKSLDFNQILLYAIILINLAGILWGLISLIRTVFFVIRMKARSETQLINGVKFYIVPETIGSFSFFKSIFISAGALKTGEVNSILAHEKIHIQQHHSLDSIFLALAKSFLWFNPIIHLFEKELKTVHEYIADSKAIEIEQNKDNYIEILMNQTIGPKMFDLTNNFNSTTIFRRLKMITKAKSTKRTLWKYLLLILPVTMSLYAFSISANEVKELKEKISENVLSLNVPALIVNSESEPKEEITKEDNWLNTFGGVWQKGVDSSASPLPNRQEYRNLFFSLKKTPEEVIKRNIACQISIDFDINTNGKISNFEFRDGKICGDSTTKKPLGYGITKEAMRVMKELSKTTRWKPAISNGKPVASKGVQTFFFGNKEVWNMYNAQASYGCGAYNAEVYMTNPCVRNFYKEPSWFLNNHFTQIMVSMGIKSDVYQDKEGGKVEISFGITPDGKPDKPEIVSSNNKALSDLALKGVNSLEGLKVKGFNHNGKRYNIEIRYEWTDQTDVHSYSIMAVPATKADSVAPAVPTVPK